MKDSLAPATVEPLLVGRLGRPYRYEESCDSTQLMLDSSSPEGAVAVSDEQTSGRGRLGRSWQAPPGTAILCSVLLRPPAKRRLQELSLIGGMAAADAVEDVLELAAQIKWPNDVMVNRRKVAGVLADAREGAIVLGIGINVNQVREQLPADARTPAASLRTIDGVARERAPILAVLLDRLESHYDAWCKAGIDAVYDFLGARDFLRGRRVAIDGASGYAVGIDRQGRLEIDTGDGRRTLDSGEVTYER
jgi:BirA family biotin operon repressor/biotin-[acetyl-CoA-carboxylase] ligase